MVAQHVYIMEPECPNRGEEPRCTLFQPSTNQLHQDEDQVQEQDEGQDQEQDGQDQEQDGQDQEQDDQNHEQDEGQDQEQGNQNHEQDEDQDKEPAGNEDASDGLRVAKSAIQQLSADECISQDSDDGCEGELIIVDVEGDTALSTPMTSSGSTSDNAVISVVQGCDLNVDSSTHHRNSARNEAQQKMEEGKLWLTKTLMFVSIVSSVVPLSSIEEAYHTYCKETKKEPLTTPVLARLIRGLFPGAVKCRLGSRGNQRIHYRNLQLKSLKVQEQSSIGMSESVKKSVHLRETSASIDTYVNGSISLTDEESTNTFGQGIQHRKDCLEKLENSEELSVVHEDGDTQNISTAVEENDEKQEGKISTTEAPNQKNMRGQITKEDNQEGCQPAAQRLTEVLKWIFSQGRKDVLLREFAHSASCQVLTCTPLCQMFRRIRRHVVAARHSCSVLRIYSMLLRLHVSSCNNSDCGLPACPALRATRPVKRSLGQQGNSPKRSAMQHSRRVLRPSTLTLAPRSPATSLPGSPVNSPPASPEHYSHGRELNWSAQAGQVQYVIVPVMMPFSDNRGA